MELQNTNKRNLKKKKNTVIKEDKTKYIYEIICLENEDLHIQVQIMLIIFSEEIVCYLNKN